jgi:hypothetical protein
VRDVLSAATATDRLWLATADGQLRSGSRESLLAELARVTPIEGAGDLPLAMRRAAAAIQTAGLPPRVVAVASDGQRTAWTSASRLGGPLALYVPAGDVPANRAVVAASAEPGRWTPRGAIVARIDAPDSVGYRILLGERTVARGAAGRGEPVLLRVSPPERGWQSGRVEIEPDDFHADDTRHFAVWIGAAPAVTSAPSAGSFVATALGALIADGRAVAGSSVALVAADSAGSLPALLLPPSDPVRLGAANRELARLGIPWRFGALDRAPTLARGARLDGVNVIARYRLVPEGAASGDTLATAGGTPWIVAGAGYVLVGSRIDPSATDLPVRAVFVPWLADVLGLRLGAPAGDLGSPIIAAPRSPLVLPAGIDALENADGGRRAVSGTQVNAPEERGVWFILRGGRRVGAIVVEASAEESALARWSARELAPRLAGRFGRGTTSPDAFVRETFASGTRRPAATPLLLLALLLIAVEAIAARTSRTTAA